MSTHRFRHAVATLCATLLLIAGSLSSFSEADAKTPLRPPTYTRPPVTAARRPAVTESELPPKAASAGDVAQSRAASGTSLRAFRSSQDYRAQFRQPSASVPPSGRFAGVPHESYDAWNGRRTSFYGGYGWSPPGYIYSSRSSFGMWDAMWMWFMLDSLSNASHAAFFYNHANDPGYVEWRSEADRLATENADLKAKLAALDTDMQAHDGQPRDPDYLPPDAAPQVALAAGSVVSEPKPAQFPWSTVIVIVLVVGGGVVAWRVWQGRSALAMGGLASGAVAGGGTMNLGTYLQNRFSGKGYTPTLFRVGMTVGFDESPFILADGRIAATRPVALGGHLVARAIGALGSGASAFHRVYVDGGFFQFHLDGQGQPDECRWFSPLDEFTPAAGDNPDDGNSWAFWLDDSLGQVGWPAFETPTGRRYERAWNPGDGRVAPRRFAEQLNEAQANRQRQHEMMLYARQTDLAGPAPDYEYALLDVVEDGEAAYVAIYAGIDINPASLALAA